MNNFLYRSTTRIIFGRDRERETGKWVAEYSHHILLVYGCGSIKRTGVYNRIVESLKEHDIKFHELSGVQPNPRIDLVREGIRICKEQEIDFILAVGGGSVIDTAKAIAFGAKYDGDVWELFTGNVSVKDTLPTGVVLTIAASGSECGGGSVITNESLQQKRSAGNGGCRPVFAIMNPELTYTVPVYQKSCGIVDILSHIMEQYFTRQNDGQFTDRLCEAAMKTVINLGPKMLSCENDYDAHAEIMLAGNYATNGLLGVGRISDWASHEIEHSLSAYYDIPHGAGLAIVIPAWMKYVYKQNSKRFAQYAYEVWDVERNDLDLEGMAHQGIQRTEAFFQSMGLSTNLTTFSPQIVKERKYKEMAEAIGKKSIGNFVKLNATDIIKIYQMCE